MYKKSPGKSSRVPALPDDDDDDDDDFLGANKINQLLCSNSWFYNQ